MKFFEFQMIISAIIALVVIHPASAKVPQDCSQFCSSQLYEEFFACKEGEYSGIIERGKHFGDIAIVAGTCAYNNGDFAIAKKFGDMSFTDHPLVWAVLKATPGKGGSAHRMFIAEAASEKLGEDAASFKNKGLQYAKNSGQCEGANDLQKCAEGYRDDIRRTLKAESGKGGGKLTDVGKIYDAFGAFCGKNQEFDVSELGCTCFDGYKKETDSKNCVLDIPATFDMESGIDLQVAVDGMPKNSFLKTKLKNKNGEELGLGVIKKQSGKTALTVDGEEYFTSLNRQFSPTLWNRISDAWGWLAERPDKLLDWGFHTKWRDDEEGQYKELQWQVANEVLEDYKEELKDDLMVFENFRKQVEEHNGYLEWFAALKEHHDEVEDTDMSLQDFGEDKLDSVFDALKEYGMTFPGTAIEKFVAEASIEAFSKPVIFYIGERMHGKTPAQIRSDDPDELAVFVSEYVFNTFGANLWDKYEESYQRFLLAREFDRKK